MKIFLSLFFFTGTLCASIDDKTLTDKVKTSNLSILSQDQAVESETVKQGSLTRSFIPTLILVGGQERFQTGKYQNYANPYGLLEARFNLFRGGRDKIESEVRDLGVKISQHNRTATVRDQINKVRKLQWQYIYNNNLIKILDQELKLNGKIKKQAEKRARSGVATVSDTLEFDIYFSELDENIESLKHENKILKIGLRPLLGLDPDAELEFPSELEHQHDDTLVTKAYEAKQNPVVAGLEAEYETHLLEKRKSNLWWTPKLDLYGGYYLYTLRDRDYLAIRERDDRVVGLSLTFELFDGLRSYNEATATHYQAEGKRLQARYTQNESQAQYGMLREDLIHTHEVMHYIEERIKMSKDYLTSTLKEYDRGVKNSLDALVAMQRYFKYEKQYLEKKKEYQTIKADLLAFRGE